MSTTLLSPGPQYNILQNVVYALPGSACNIVLGTACERSDLYAGPFVGWAGGYNKVGGFIRCLTGNTTYKATKLKMAELKNNKYSSAILASNPSNYWRLNESSGVSVRDQRGGVNGTISGGVTLNQAGINNDAAMLFNGTTGKIVTSLPINMSTTVTVEAWIKTTAVVHQSIWSNKQPGGIPTSAVHFGTNNIGQLFVQADALGVGTASTPVNDGQWHHVVWVQNGATVLLYVDGTQDYTAGAPFSGNNLTISIGANLQNGSYFNGLIDEVAMYSRVLTPAEILSHYQSRA